MISPQICASIKLVNLQLRVELFLISGRFIIIFFFIAVWIAVNYYISMATWN